MNISENNQNHMWSLWTFVVVSFILTVFTMVAAIFKFERHIPVIEDSPQSQGTVQGSKASSWSVSSLLRPIIPFRIIRIKVEGKPLGMNVV